MNGTEPRIRFEGFDGAWETGPLSRHLSVSEERNEDNRYGAADVFSVSREHGVVNQIEFQGRSFAGASLLGYRVIHKGQIAYTKSPLKAAPYGIVKADKRQSGIVSALYGVYDASADADFVQTFFENDDRLNAYLRPLVNKGAKNTLLVSDEDALSGEVRFPSLPEQRRIAELFRNLDETIAATDARLEKLRQSKKSLLEKMFPRPGASVPEIRFKGFEGEWETRKLGDKGKTISGVGFPEADQGGVFGTPFFKVSDMSNPGNESLMVRANNYVSEEQIRKHSWHPVENLPAILFAKVGAAALLNRKRLVKNRFLMDNNMMAYCLNDGCNADFFKFLFESIDLSSFVQVGALPSINGKDIESKAVRFPSLPEQQRIGSFFRELDKLIESVQKKAAKLRQVKSALLEEMFV